MSYSVVYPVGDFDFALDGGTFDQMVSYVDRFSRHFDKPLEIKKSCDVRTCDDW